MRPRWPTAASWLIGAAAVLVWPAPAGVFNGPVTALAAAAVVGAPRANSPPSDRPRLLVLTDIGGDPDDQQSLIRLLLYANEFELEGLIASASGTPGELKDKVTKPELIREIVEAYGKVRPNLIRHAPGYPIAEQLLAQVKVGNRNRGREAVGEGQDTEGSGWIIAAADRPASGPLHISIWGGQTDLAPSPSGTLAINRRSVSGQRGRILGDQGGVPGVTGDLDLVGNNQRRVLDEAILALRVVGPVVAVRRRATPARIGQVMLVVTGEHVGREHDLPDVIQLGWPLTAGGVRSRRCWAELTETNRASAWLRGPA